MVLVALVAMMVSGVAMIRSMDTGQMVAGNLAARNATVNSADSGVQAAVAWLQANSTTGALNADAPASGYYSYGTDQLWTSSTFWNTCTTCAVTDNANNTVSWTISRMCKLTGSPGGVGNFCASVSGGSSNNGSMSSDAVTYIGSPKYFYRVTVQVVNARNSSTLSQAFITL